LSLARYRMPSMSERMARPPEGEQLGHAHAEGADVERPDAEAAAEDICRRPAMTLDLSEYGRPWTGVGRIRRGPGR